MRQRTESDIGLIMFVILTVLLGLRSITDTAPNYSVNTEMCLLLTVFDFVAFVVGCV